MLGLNFMFLLTQAILITITSSIEVRIADAQGPNGCLLATNGKSFGCLPGPQKNDPTNKHCDPASSINENFPKNCRHQGLETCSETRVSVLDYHVCQKGDDFTCVSWEGAQGEFISVWQGGDCKSGQISVFQAGHGSGFRLTDGLYRAHCLKIERPQGNLPEIDIVPSNPDL